MRAFSIHRHPGSCARPRGFSLVEILVALAISLFLVAGIIQLFVGSKQTYRFHDGLSRIQENGRFALELMARDIRMAGHYGCLPASAPITNILNTPTAYFWNFGQAIQGFESTGANTWSPALDASIASPFSGSNVDAITIRGQEGAVVPVLAHGGGTLNPRASNGGGFAACDVVVAATCQIASAFQVTGVTAVAAAAGPPAIPAGVELAHAAGGACGGAPGNSSDNVAADFAGGEVARVATKSYYIRTGASGRPALWRRVGAAVPQELVEGVERMEIRYGVCTNTGSARQVSPPYVNANGVANWASVCSVRIDLLLASVQDNLVTNPQTVIFPADTGTSVAPGDRRLRQGFSATVGIRNRLP